MKRVLIAPLDWGLGHATRCIPVIREFQRQGCAVVLAGSGDSLTLLEHEFPDVRSFSLPGYRPRYPANGSMGWTMALQLPHFLKVISDEHRAIENILEREKIDLVISDNRYGCWSRKVHSVFITHQSNILMPKRFRWLQGLVKRLNERMINRFQTCWIPDVPGNQSLAGDMAFTGNDAIKIPRQFIGCLSRFEPKNVTVKKYDVLAIFSGPEPQRTLLENMLLPQLKNSGLTFFIVRGLPGHVTNPPDERMVNFLTSGELQTCIEASDVVIARSGYSTVMDMHALGRKVIFVPTPGQTEQEYLARRLREKGFAFFMDQNEFNLETALRQYQLYTGFSAWRKNSLLSEAIASVLDPDY